jgi:tRNA modification GTPase
MLPHLKDTIAAIASPPGSAARGIVRISGPGLGEVLKAIVSPQFAQCRGNPSRYPIHLDLPDWTRPIAVDLYLWPGRRSYTRQPVAELHVAGSPPLLEAVLSHVCRKGARLAQPGEFTLRAFLAGRMDLTQAEGVLGVIDARSQDELQAALNQLSGGLSIQLGGLRSDLMDLLADLEAGLDFAEEDIEFISGEELLKRLTGMRDEVLQMKKHARERTLPTRRPRVVLAGPPNAGKSTLFNALVGRDVALVSAERGTTRDFLTADVVWDSLALTLVDTAGEESIRGIGIAADAQSQRKAQVAAADLVVWCRPVTEHGDWPSAAGLWVATKVDEFDQWENSDDRILPVSAHRDRGLREVQRAIVGKLTAETYQGGDWLGSTAARGREALSQAAESLTRAVALAENTGEQTLLAIELSDALDALGIIVGAVYTDDILDRLFQRFCIGK